MNNFFDLLSQKEFEKYKAHIPTDNSLPKETLWQHSFLTKTYYENIAKANGIDSVLQNLITDIVKEFYVEENQKWADHFIHRLFVYSIVLHDLGKLNPNFQKNKMKEKFSFIKAEEGSNHAKLGSFIFFNSFLNEFLEKYNNKTNNKEKFITIFLIFVFSIPIFKHHSAKLEKNKFEDIFSKEFIEEAYELLSQNFLSFEKEKIKTVQDNITKKVFSDNRNSDDNPFLVFALLKLNYSLLTASDYYATNHFMQNWQKNYNEFGVLNNTLRQKIIYNIENTESYNQKTYQELDSYKLVFPLEINNSSLNKLRQNLATEVIHSVRKNISKNLFYIEAPTGGGKTNLSMLALAEFLRNDVKNNTDSVRKIFYVFPFTTLITQTFKALQKTLGLNENQIVQIHSKAGFSSKKNISNTDKEEDAVYGSSKENLIDYQFVNYPLALFSHVKFFDILKSNQKSINYLLHRLANSVVIIDELQSYTPKLWDKIIFFINNYSRYFNIKFILMSATLPKIDKLLSEKSGVKNLENDFVYLIEDKNKYFQNPNFQARVDFDFSLLEKMSMPQKKDKQEREEFLEKLWEKIEMESAARKKELGRVHAIIEFIFKKSANEFFHFAEKANVEVFDEIFILSGTTIEPKRKEIIAKLKHLDYQKKNILLVTTQVVEAGIDIDMDIGFKNISLIDSDEQLAGRINRNVNKDKSKLFLFQLDDAKNIYQQDLRLKEIVSQEEHKKILQNKNFDDGYYDKVIEQKNLHNNQSAYIDNLPAYIKKLKELDFSNINKEFQLIEERDDATIFVPIDIPVNIPYSQSNDKDNNTEQNFSQEELEFLKSQQKYSDEDYISGKKVFELYEEIIQNKKRDFNENFVQQKINFLKIQGLLSKFVFSVGIYSAHFNTLKEYGGIEEKYGFYYINHPEQVYDYNHGLNNIDGIDNIDDCFL